MRIRDKFSPMASKRRRESPEDECGDRDAMARESVHDVIREGLDDVAYGQTRPAREAFE